MTGTEEKAEENDGEKEIPLDPNEIISIASNISDLLEEICGKSNKEQLEVFHGIVCALSQFICERAGSRTRALLLIGMATSTLSMQVSANLELHVKVDMGKNFN